MGGALKDNEPSVNIDSLLPGPGLGFGLREGLGSGLSNTSGERRGLRGMGQFSGPLLPHPFPLQPTGDANE